MEVVRTDIVAIVIEIVIALVGGVLLWKIKKHFDVAEVKRSEHEKAHEDLMLHLLRNTESTCVLAMATAKAVQRIPDAKCNGDMTAALKAAQDIQNAEKSYLYEQGIQHIVGK